jgi:hypothetical protein
VIPFRHAPNTTLRPPLFAPPLLLDDLLHVADLFFDCGGEPQAAFSAVACVPAPYAPLIVSSVHGGLAELAEDEEPR